MKKKGKERSERSSSLKKEKLVLVQPHISINISYVAFEKLTLIETNKIQWESERKFRTSKRISVQSLSRVRLSATPWTAACQASLSITNSRSLLIHVHWVRDAIQPSHPLLPPSPALNLAQHQVSSSESALHIKWQKYWSFRFSISLSSEYSGLISFRIDWFDLLAVQGTLESLL